MSQPQRPSAGHEEQVQSIGHDIDPYSDTCSRCSKHRQEILAKCSFYCTPHHREQVNAAQEKVLTDCWNCSKAYDIAHEACDHCGVYNANIRFEDAQRQRHEMQAMSRRLEKLDPYKAPTIEQDRQAWRAWFGAYSEPVKPFGSRG